MRDTYFVMVDLFFVVIVCVVYSQYILWNGRSIVECVYGNDNEYVIYTFLLMFLCVQHSAGAVGVFSLILLVAKCDEGRNL